MKTSIINVTPQIASDWLKRNTDNRPLRKSVVQQIKAALLRGEYVPTHQGIAFSTDGSLLDGQHRLTAISELRDGVFPMLVSIDVHPNAFLVTDTGFKRTASDMLQISKKLSEVARLAATFCGSHNKSITATMMIPFVMAVDPLHDELLRYCGTTRRTWSSAPVRLAAVIAMLNGVDKDYVKATYRAMVLADFDAMTPIARALYSANINDKFRVNGDIDTMARLLRIFDPKKAALKKVQVFETKTAIEFIKMAFSDIEIPGADTEKTAAPSSAAKSIPRPHYLMAAQ